MPKLDKFAEFKRAKEGARRTWKPTEETKIYDEVSEDQYKDIVKGRLQQDDFVVDDGIGGYADNGMDDWGQAEVDDAHASEEDDAYIKKRQKKVAKTTAKPKKAPPPPADMSAYRPVVSEAKEEDFMNNLLSTMDTSVPVSSTRNLKRKPSYLFDTPSSPLSSSSSASNLRHRPQSRFNSSDPVDSDHNSAVDNLPFSPAKKQRLSDDGKTGITPAANKLTQFGLSSPDKIDTNFDSPYDNYMDNDDFGMDLDPGPAAFVKKEEMMEVELPAAPETKVNSIADIKAEEKEDKDALPSWLSVHAALNVMPDSLGSSGQTSSSVNVEVLEKDGSLHFYWIDYLENDGKVYFIGKVKDKETKGYVSCCVTVEGIERNLYVLPRERRLDDDEDEAPTQDDVEDDFEQVRRKFGIKSCAHKWVKRKYAFGEEGVPVGESDWLKVVYGFDEPQIPKDVSSPNFSRIFGTNTSAFELLVLKRKIMGPCWLRVKNAEVAHKGVSWCKVEATISDPKDINPFPETDPFAPTEMPPLTITSLSVRTIVNHRENKREIVCVTARTWTNTQIDDPKPPSELPCTVHTLIRPLVKFPAGFEVEAKKLTSSQIKPMKNERMLLSQLLVILNRTDPDVIVGHEFLGVSLDVLLHRLRELKCDHWSRIGRFRRSRWPNIGRQGTNLKFLSGRLLCDLASDGAKGMIASTTWSLTEMCASHLKISREDIDPEDLLSYLDGDKAKPTEMVFFVQHCEMDSYFQMAISSKVQMLPLTKQLTNLAGNSWNKTLNGGRAERNEYILLHEFHRLKYICPDKTWGKKSALAAKAEAEDGDAAAVTTKGKKDKYKGGLVFEPKKGLWDKIILVMDFNSLYPSIIQEYNIDFTTVEKVESEDGEEKIPEPPSPDIPQGVLPRLIATLVGRRRQVKSLMKDRSVTPAKMLQYDIKQQALKLTANSMYGCLGFEYSRFYARPLAALTTFKGRETLTQTRELAESMKLDVVYGDTDSVFINSNVIDLAEALKTAHEFKKRVNERYKLLEIDLDGVFERLLLLQKKKYAALKVEEGGKTRIEVKGLDMKRREYCQLSKNVSQYVLEQVLSSDDTETVVQHIHEFLTGIGERVRAGKVPIDDFIISKRLGKNPEDYPDAKSQPHVQVALKRKAKGVSAKNGDVIQYIFCLGDNGESSKSAQADRAHHPDDIRKPDTKLKIDFEHYLSQQVLPPIERLCEPIEGTDRSRLAECLGLDPSRYRTASTGEFEDRVFGILDSQLADKDRFKDAKPFTVSCAECDGETAFEPLYNRDRSLVTSAGPRCLACSKQLSSSNLQLQLDLQIRYYIAKYYEAWTECNEPTCNNRTRMMEVYGRNCMKPTCDGEVKLQYSDLQLYNQLLYYASLFNPDKISKGAKGSGKEDEVVALVNVNKGLLDLMAGTVEKHLNNCSRRWVDLDGLFSFMKL